MTNLTLGSLFDGSGGFPLGGMLAGITPLWASEIEPFAIRVTTRRLPQMKHYGDVSSLNGAELPPVDIITFGSPCQDMSIAGKRSGLGGARSGLFYEAVRIIKEMRCATNGKYPQYCVWENVPGVFSSNKGEDFRCVLESLCKIKDETVSVPRHERWTAAGNIVAKDFSIAWRVLDAQYWGVPQRRKRIYLVADFNSECAGKILFESEGVSGYSAEGFKAWQRTAALAENSIGAASECLTAAGTTAVVYENHSQDTRYTGPLEIAPTVSSTYGMGGNNQPFVVSENTRCFDVRFTSEGTRNSRQNCYETDTARTIDTGGNAPDSNQGGVAVVYGICSDGSNSMKSFNPHSGIYHAETARTLDCKGGDPFCHQGGIAVVAVQGSMIGRSDQNGPQGSGVNEDVSFTLNTTDRHAVAFSPARVYSTSKNSYHTEATENVASTLVASDYKDPPTVAEEPQYIVRRLMPTECARLQGFPDWWCADLETAEPTEDELEFWRHVFETHRNITSGSKKAKSDKQLRAWLKSPHSDSAEYKLWGNGVALPCVFFVLSGIVYYSQLNVESL